MKGVKSYSGYISLNATTNMFFWFFEARTNPQDAPVSPVSLFSLFDPNLTISDQITLWYSVEQYKGFPTLLTKYRLNGGPGADSLLGLFQGELSWKMKATK